MITLMLGEGRTTGHNLRQIVVMNFYTKTVLVLAVAGYVLTD